MFHARLLHVVFGALAGEAHVFRDFTGSSARTGILRDVSFCCGSRYSTSFASLSRSLPLAVRARTVSFSGPTSTVAFEFASRLTYHAGWAAAPLADAITTKTSPDFRYPTTAVRGSPVRAPVVVSSSSWRPAMRPLS